jgi:hypothetical protein
VRFLFRYYPTPDLWAECSRLLANCIILYNASILSRLLEHQGRTGNTQGADATKKVSPVSWQHINLQGRYEFQKQPTHSTFAHSPNSPVIAGLPKIWIEPFRGDRQKTP